MRGKKVKALRRKVYGDGSKRNEYRYSWKGKQNLTARCIGKRAEYLKLKKES